MNAKVITALFTTFVMLFAGVTMVGADDVSAEASTIQFEVDGTIYSKITETFPTLEELGAVLDDNQKFNGWEDGREMEAGPGLFAPGTTIPTTEDYTGAEWSAKITVITYTVKFMDINNVIIGSAHEGIALDATVTPPVEVDDFPAVEGKLLIGWTDAEGNLVELVNGDVVVKSDMVLKATYKADPVVTFVVDGITTYSHYTTGLDYPDNPIKTDFTFLGWAVDGEIVLDADATDLSEVTIEKDTTFVAMFEPALHTVTFTVDGVAVSTQTVKHGEFATEPAFVPAKEGYDFVEWDFDFRNPIMADMTIEAIFAEVVEPEPEGLDDPVTQTAVILGGLVVIILLAVLISKVKKGEPILGLKVEKAKKKDKEDDE